MKKYSVLVPAYNVEKYITECVSSIVNQVENENIEVIIADDGSTDRTSQLCDELASRYNNVMVYHKKNEGQLDTRLFLLEQSQGDYCIFCDADDKWEPFLIDTVDKYINKYLPDVLIFGFNYWTQSEKRAAKNSFNSFKYFSGSTMNELWPELLCTNNFNSIWSKVIRKKIIRKDLNLLEYQSIRYGEDKLQLISIFNNADSVVIIPDYLYNYRIDNQGISRVFNPAYFSDTLKVKKVEFNWMVKKNIDTAYNRHILALTLLSMFTDYIVRIKGLGIDNVNHSKKPYQFTKSKDFQDIMNWIDKSHTSIKQRLHIFAYKQGWVSLLRGLYQLKHFIYRK